jgi:hypothetical protein
MNTSGTKIPLVFMAQQTVIFHPGIKLVATPIYFLPLHLMTEAGVCTLEKSTSIDIEDKIRSKVMHLKNSHKFS